MAKNDFKAAEAHFRLAAEADPTSPDGHLHLAAALARTNKLDESIQAAWRALAANPKLFPAFQLLSGVLQRQGKFQESIAAAEQAISLDPRQVRPYVDIVRAKRVTGADRELIDRLAQMVDEPFRSQAEKIALRYAMGKANDDLGNYSEAATHFDAANNMSLKEIGASLGYDSAREEKAATNLINFFNPDLFSRHKGLGSNADLPVLIVGMIRSGTTLLNTILSTHPRIATAGELPFWEDRGVPLLINARNGSLAPERIEALASEYRQLLRRYGPASDRVVDKMPMNYQFLGLVHLVFPNAIFLHIKRDPIDTCISIWTTQFDLPPNFAFSKRNIADTYRNYRRLMDHWRQVIPSDRLMEVDYEEIVRDREPVLRQILQFLKVNWSQDVLSHERNKAEVSTPSIWQARQPVYGRSMERWRNYPQWKDEFAELL